MQKKTGQDHFIEQVEADWDKLYECICFSLDISDSSKNDKNVMKERVLLQLRNEWESTSLILKKHFKCNTNEELEEKLFMVNEDTTAFFYWHIMKSKNAKSN